MKEDRDWYRTSSFLDMQSAEKEDKKRKKQEQKKRQNKIARRIDLCITITIVLALLIFLVFFYKPNQIDFLEDIKNTFIYGMISILGIISILMIVLTFFMKEKKILSNILKILLFFNIVFLIIFFYIEASLDAAYNSEETFGEIYDAKIENKSDTEYVDVWKTLIEQEVKTKTEREVFIEQSLSQFTYFKIRVYLIFILYVIMMMTNTYIISKIDKEIKGRAILDKDDKILFKNK